MDEDGVRFLNSLAYSWAMSSIIFYAFCTRTSGKIVYQLGKLCALLGGAHDYQPIMSLIFARQYLPVLKLT